MSAVLGIINSHDGALQLSSSPGVGTTFKVYFPLPDKKNVVETDLVPGSFPLAKGRGTILLVDDEQALRTIGSALLGSMGFTVISAANGREAIEAHKACDSVIDLVMLDLTMPEMGGVAAYHELRELDPNVPILFCSGYGAESASDITTTDNNSLFLRKPYNPIELRRVLNELIGG